MKDPADCLEATEEVYNIIKESLPPLITKEKFLSEYSDAVSTALNLARQNVQAEGKKAAECT